MSGRISKKAAIASVRALIPNKNFDKIVSMCSLEPVYDWHTWNDTEGNILKITKPGGILVFPATKLIDKTYDVFRKSHPSMIAKYSSWVLAMLGEDRSLICFLGYDGILRSSYFRDKKWVENVPPLLCGGNILQIIASGYIDTSVKEIKSPTCYYDKNEFCQSTWLSGFPIKEELLKRKVDCHLIV
jgi:hypothetical protein